MGESATTKTSETPRDLSLTGVWTQNMIMKALTALFCLFVLVSGLDNESCEDRGGALSTDNKASGHSLQWTKALISKPAPHFEGTAVVKGQMKELKLTDYRGKYLVFFFYPLAFTFVCPTEILAFNDPIDSKRRRVGNLEHSFVVRPHPQDLKGLWSV